MNNRFESWAEITGTERANKDGSVEIASGECLLLPGDHITPNNWTMPPQAVPLSMCHPICVMRGFGTGLSGDSLPPASV